MSTNWTPDLSRRGKPHYRAIADAIADDVRAGRLGAADRLPPQRVLAQRLELDFTTVARGYVEAQRRGLIESRVGQGTFVAGAPARAERAAPPIADLTMNLAPEPEDPALLDRMRAGVAKASADLSTLLRYQAFGGAYLDRETACAFLAERGLAVEPERLLICPGTHVAFQAVLQVLAQPGEVVACEALTYPGIRAIVARAGLSLVGIALDDEGIEIDAFEAACRLHAPRVLYLNPTMLNPTASTMPEARRRGVIEIARRHRVTILEDDAYGAIPREPPPAFAQLAPDITYYVSGLSKCLGAGLRIAYAVAPDARRAWALSTVMRTASVMASPITLALATLWLRDGTGAAILASIRAESRARQAIAAELLPPGSYFTHPEGFHLWLALPKPWQRSAFAAEMRASCLGIVASDAFTVSGPPPEAVRVSLGGMLSRAEVRAALDFMAHILEGPATLNSG